MAARLRHTTHLEDAKLVMARLGDALRPWKAGDRCLSYDLRAVTSVRLVEGGIATLANGDTCHVSRIRSVPARCPVCGALWTPKGTCPTPTCEGELAV